MQDRVPLYPGRVKLTPVSGQSNTYDMTMADQPTVEGTPLNKETLLNNNAAAAVWPDASERPSDPTVSEALAELGSNTLRYKKQLFTEVITKDMDWKAPSMLTGDVSVRVFGGGGGGSNRDDVFGAGGGGGEMAYGVYSISSEATVPISIGIGGAGLPGGSNANGNNGGVTSFGGYLSADGGQGGQYDGNGGNGGTGGGGSYNGNGGNATYGGGGGGAGARYDGNGGNGGTYGGGGGRGGYDADPGIGGTYGGNGGDDSSVGVGYDGTDTTSLNLDFVGEGKGGTVYDQTTSTAASGTGGGGGYGGNGGTGSGGSAGDRWSGGGGGGYGGNGGNGANSLYSSGGGGGGGYGGNGGNGEPYNEGCGGGGGGYGLNGNGGSANGVVSSGAYVATMDGGLAAGGSGNATPNTGDAYRSGSGGNGCVVLTYYAYVIDTEGTN